MRKVMEFMWETVFFTALTYGYIKFIVWAFAH